MYVKLKPMTQQNHLLFNSKNPLEGFHGLGWRFHIWLTPYSLSPTEAFEYTCTRPKHLINVPKNESFGDL